MFERQWCPYCVARTGSRGTHKNLSVNIETGSFRCHRCQASGVISRKGRRRLLERNAHAVAEAPRDYPDDYQPLYPAGTLHDLRLIRAREYVLSRGVSDGEIRRSRLGFSRGKVVFPLLDDRFKGFITRSDFGYLTSRGARPTDGALYGARYMYGPELWVVEGPFDRLRLAPFVAVVATLGKGVSVAQADRIAEFPGRVVVCFDGDAWDYSRSLALELKLLRRNGGVFWVKLPPKKDPGEMGALVFKRKLRSV